MKSSKSQLYPFFGTVESMMFRNIVSLLIAGFLLTLGILSAEEAKRITPIQALDKLLQGNARYIADKLEHPNRSAERREAISSKQEPFAIIVGCSDSRVSPEIVFDQGIGDLFVVRVAGNVVGPIEMASVEFSSVYLQSSIIIVLGHENCGAVSAVLNHQAKAIEPIATKIEAALYRNKHKFNGTPLENAIKANIKAVVEEIRANDVISNLIAEKKIEVVGGYYHLESGKVELCCETIRESMGVTQCKRAPSAVSPKQEESVPQSK
jgi:carbonic anhydrase